MKKDIVFVDTETTGLLKAIGSDLIFQPHMIEIFIRRTNNKLIVLDDFESLVKPPVPIPGFITRITGISDLDVHNSPRFKAILKKVRLILKNATFVAHNLTFDRSIIVNEFSRCKKNSPISTSLFCTVEQSMHLKGHRLKLSELHKIATKKEKIVGAHRAKMDVLALVESYRWLTKC